MGRAFRNRSLLSNASPFPGSRAIRSQAGRARLAPSLVRLDEEKSLRPGTGAPHIRNGWYIASRSKKRAPSVKLFRFCSRELLESSPLTTIGEGVRAILILSRGYH